ncbi:hypothetical protein EDM53_01635, partial [Rickettsiales endosymbiont of Peranema trichophorum]|uniref:hypothetical protein n=1 Tax=Rickettsiales endosymbiont of Peranema trichophorum TaxID=2486577 RepID=UPI001022DB7F
MSKTKMPPELLRRGESNNEQPKSHQGNHKKRENSKIREVINLISTSPFEPSNIQNLIEQLRHLVNIIDDPTLRSAIESMLQHAQQYEQQQATVESINTSDERRESQKRFDEALKNFRNELLKEEKLFWEKHEQLMNRADELINYRPAENSFEYRADRAFEALDTLSQPDSTHTTPEARETAENQLREFIREAIADTGQLEDVLKAKHARRDETQEHLYSLEQQKKRLIARGAPKEKIDEIVETAGQLEETVEELSRDINGINTVLKGVGEARTQDTPKEQQVTDVINSIRPSIQALNQEKKAQTHQTRDKQEREGSRPVVGQEGAGAPSVSALDNKQLEHAKNVAVNAGEVFR